MSALRDASKSYDPKFPPWFNEQTQARIARRYHDNGASIRQIQWMMVLSYRQVGRLLDLPEDGA